MASDIVPIDMNHTFCEVFMGKWKLSNLLNYEKKKLISPPFCPLKSVALKFCFELWFSEYTSDGTQNSLFKLVLAKLDGSFFPASLKLRFDLLRVVHSSDHAIVSEYRKLPFITVKDMDYYHFDSIYHPYVFKSDNKLTPFGMKLNRDSSLILICRLSFFDHLLSPKIKCAPLRLLRKYKTLNTSSEDFKSFKRSDKLSDIIVLVENKPFISHKSVLSRSSVLKQKIAQTSDVLVLNDKMCKAFDKFLDYLYSGDFEDMPFPMVKDVYALSAKYKVDELKKKCADAMLSHLSVDTVFDILKVANNFIDLHLYEPSIQFVADHPDELFSSEEERNQFYASNSKSGCDLAMRVIRRTNSLKSSSRE